MTFGLQCTAQCEFTVSIDIMYSFSFRNATSWNYPSEFGRPLAFQQFRGVTLRLFWSLSLINVFNQATINGVKCRTVWINANWTRHNLPSTTRTTQKKVLNKQLLDWLTDWGNVSLPGSLSHFLPPRLGWMQVGTLQKCEKRWQMKAWKRVGSGSTQGCFCCLAVCSVFPGFSSEMLIDETGGGHLGTNLTD